MDDETTDAGQGLRRREAIKKAAAAGVVMGLTWSAPRVEGLSLRPNYAAAGSSSSAVLEFMLDTTFSNCCPSRSATCCGIPVQASINGLVGGQVGALSGSMTPSMTGPTPLNVSVNVDPASANRGFSAANGDFTVNLQGMDATNTAFLRFTYNCA